MTNSTFSREDLANSTTDEAVEVAADDAADKSTHEGGDEVEAVEEPAAGESVSARTGTPAAPERAFEEEDDFDFPVADARDQEPMPDMADEDVQFDSDKYRAKMQRWVQHSVETGVATALAGSKARQSLEAKISRFAKDHPDWDQVVARNPVLAANQLAPDAAVVVARSPYAAELLYRFGKDTKLAIRVAGMDPVKQVMSVVNMIRDVMAEKSATTTRTSASTTQRQAQAPVPARKVPGPLTRDQQLSGKTSMADFARQSRGNRYGGRFYK